MVELAQHFFGGDNNEAVQVNHWDYGMKKKSKPTK